MAVFSVPIEVGNLGGGDMMGISAVVDTGAAHTMLRESLLAQIRVDPMLEKSFSFGDGNEETMPVGFCRIAWRDEEAVCPVIFGPEGKYLMGATTLEIFDVAVEPGQHRLVPRIHHERPYF